MAAARLSSAGGVPPPAGGERVRVPRVGATVAGLTLLASIAGAVDPSLAPSGHPHPTLRGTPGEALSILEHNVRALGAPLILALARWGRGRATRLVGDTIVTAIVVTDTTVVGLALGRFQLALLPYVPQLPLEWTALTLAVCTWAADRRGRRNIRTISRYAAGTIAFTVVAALLETFAVPRTS
jgi:hypothetical protein